MSTALSVTEADVLDALRTVPDPEIGLDVVTLGLVYAVSVDGPRVSVRYTLTTPGCPMEAHISNAMAAVLYALPGVAEVCLDLVFEPRWSPDLIEDGAW